MVTTLGLALCAAAIATTLQSMVFYQAQTLRLHGASHRAYWLARGAALAELSELRTKTTSVTVTKDVATAGGDVEESVMVGTVDTVRVEVSVSGAVNVVVFSFDPSTQRVVSWQDNAP